MLYNIDSENSLTNNLILRRVQEIKSILLISILLSHLCKCQSLMQDFCKFSSFIYVLIARELASYTGCTIRIFLWRCQFRRSLWQIVGTILQECQPEFLHDLVLKMKAYIFTPGDSICRKGEVAREMFIIADGILEVISETGRVLTTMKAGDFFGEIGILNLDGLNKWVKFFRLFVRLECDCVSIHNGFTSHFV